MSLLLKSIDEESVVLTCSLGKANFNTFWRNAVEITISKEGVKEICNLLQESTGANHFHRYVNEGSSLHIFEDNTKYTKGPFAGKSALRGVPLSEP